ncbi:ArdC family protein, partial [Tenacibaculum amylolyticum]|uniref:ArdC family protein n=1 Tax=Tenacibaculum amylolyticum TaxID=104269 RepID=UPI0038B5EA14
FPYEFLAGLEYIEVSDTEGLGRAQLTPDKIYKRVTQKMIDKMSKSKGRGKKRWDDTYDTKDGFLLPVSYNSKKPYKGINIGLLEIETPVYENPFFLTEKQVKQAGGTLRKGAKRFDAVYFTHLYKYKNTKKEEGFKTYNKGKMKDYLTTKNIDVDRFHIFVDTIPILTAHEVFNGSDVKGIDFGLDKLTELQKVMYGFKKAGSPNNKGERNKIAELIIKNFPKNMPTIKHGYKGASYNGGTDLIKMPKFEAFYSADLYYSTLFHEAIHSTGHFTRLDRPLGNKFGSAPYAREELIAELGATYLCAYAGILWRTEKENADYLKNWRLALKFMGDDKKFIMQAATKAQKAVDFLLQMEKGKPKFYADLEKQIKADEKALQQAE